MEHFVILPDDSGFLPYPMKKFVFISDDFQLSFIVKDKFSETRLREQLDITQKYLDEIVEVVKSNYTEEEIGESEFSEITTMAKIERILSGEA